MKVILFVAFFLVAAFIIQAVTYLLAETGILPVLLFLFLIYLVVIAIKKFAKLFDPVDTAPEIGATESFITESELLSEIPNEITGEELTEIEKISKYVQSMEFIRVDEKWGYIQGEHRQFRLFYTSIWSFGFRIEAIVSNDSGDSVNVIDVLLDGKSQLTHWFLEKDKTDIEFLDFVMNKLWHLAYREKIPFSNIKELDEFLGEVAFNNYLLKEGLISYIESEEDVKVEYQWVS